MHDAGMQVAHGLCHVSSHPQQLAIGQRAASSRAWRAVQALVQGAPFC